MINNSSDESAIKISLIDTKSMQPKQSFCQKYFLDCFIHRFFRKKQENLTKDETKYSISKSYEEKPYEVDYLEINFEENKKTKMNQKNFLSKYKVENFPQNELFLLEGSTTKKPILVKVSEKHFPKTDRISDDLKDASKSGFASFFSTASQSDRISKQLKKLPFCFPNYSEKIKYNIDYLNDSDFPDENFAEYIASKLQGNMILDFSGGIGEYTIPIAKKSNFVISCSSNAMMTGYMKENSELYGINNIDFVNYPEQEKNDQLKEFLVMKNKNNKADGIILNPLTIIRNFSSKKIYNANLKKILKHLSKNSKSFVIILPKHFQNFEGLADLLADGLKRNERCGVEIEKIFKNNKLKHLVIYYGLISGIKGSEEMAFIHNLVEKFEEKESPVQETLKNNFRCISNQVSNNYGNMILLEIIVNAIKEYPKEKNLNIYSYILNIFKKNTFGFSCIDNPKNCGHELGLVKSFSSNLDHFKLKPLLTKTNSSEEIVDGSRKFNKNSESSIDKSEKNNKSQTKLLAIESFASDGNDLVSDYSKSFQGNLQYEEPEGERKSFIVDVRRMKRSESGAHNTLDSFDKNHMGTYFNSLNEKSLI